MLYTMYCSLILDLRFNLVGCEFTVNQVNDERVRTSNSKATSNEIHEALSMTPAGHPESHHLLKRLGCRV